MGVTSRIQTATYLIDPKSTLWNRNIAAVMIGLEFEYFMMIVKSRVNLNDMKTCSLWYTNTIDIMTIG